MKSGFKRSSNLLSKYTNMSVDVDNQLLPYEFRFGPKDRSTKQTELNPT